MGRAGALCSVVPDLDVLGFRLGIHYGDFWGHRGFTHSLLFAALLAASVSILAFRCLPGTGLLWIWGYLFLVTASHGLLDAMTDGGLGVAFFSPFSNDRYFLPWKPIRVSPIGVGRFFTERGWTVLQSELLWIWLPSTLLAGLVVEATPHVGCLILPAVCQIALFTSNSVLDNSYFSDSIFTRKYYGLESAAVPAAFFFFRVRKRDGSHLESITCELPQICYTFSRPFFFIDLRIAQFASPLF